jgi:hypothetical protein
MATGVLIVLIYIWSGESLVALALSIITLLAVAVIIEWRPWAVAPGSEVLAAERGARSNDQAGGPGRTTKPHGRPVHDALPVWRGRFDITWDGRGVSGVVVGTEAPQLWSWTQIDDISQAWYEDDRIALCLDFPSLRNPEEPAQAPVMFGPDQQPDEVVRQLREAWRESKVPRSRFHDLPRAERTRLLAEHLGHPGGSEAEFTMSSPALLYQEVRRALLAAGHLCRITPDLGIDDIADRFDRLLEANGVEPLSRSEAEELDATDRHGPDPMGALHWTLDWVAEQRGLRLAFIDQTGAGAPGGRAAARSGSGPTPGPRSAGADHERPDYLIGLISADSADDWDGQPIGSGSTRIMLDPP